MIYRSLAAGLTAVALGALAACQQPTTSEATGPDVSVLKDAMASIVEDQLVMGAAVLVYQGGEEVFFAAEGFADLEADRAWDRDTLVAIYSMTKPVTGVALMTLYEEGLFALDDPLSKYLPEYADVKVFEGLDEAGEMILVEPKRPLQVIDILRHTSCYGYGWGDGPVDEAARALNPLDPTKPLAQFSEEMATLPLECHPGERWVYGVSVDIQARLVEVLSGQTFEAFLQSRIFDPLALADTGYVVAPGDRDRVAAVYQPTEEGGLERADQSGVYTHWETKPVQTNGGHGLVASIDDYMRFALMLQNEGSLGDATIIQPDTLELMTTNQLPDTVIDEGFLPEKGAFGFGIDFAVRTGPWQPDDQGFGHVGEYMWDGAASTTFWVDPVHDVTVVYLTQLMPYSNESHRVVRRAVYEALDLLEQP
ncbi:MAG: beta-lactamase family protein [Parvularculaceae bacterium]|nr:beta-lactamase family protein [Parvularculaceae bacterium]